MAPVQAFPGLGITPGQNLAIIEKQKQADQKAQAEAEQRNIEQAKAEEKEAPVAPVASGYRYGAWLGNESGDVWVHQKTGERVSGDPYHFKENPRTEVLGAAKDVPRVSFTGSLTTGQAQDMPKGTSVAFGKGGTIEQQYTDTLIARQQEAKVQEQKAQSIQKMLESPTAQFADQATMQRGFDIASAANPFFKPEQVKATIRTSTPEQVQAEREIIGRTQKDIDINKLSREDSQKLVDVGVLKYADPKPGEWGYHATPGQSGGIVGENYDEIYWETPIVINPVTGKRYTEPDIPGEGIVNNKNQIIINQEESDLYDKALLKQPEELSKSEKENRALFIAIGKEKYDKATEIINKRGEFIAAGFGKELTGAERVKYGFANTAGVARTYSGIYTNIFGSEQEKTEANRLINVELGRTSQEYKDLGMGESALKYAIESPLTYAIPVGVQFKAGIWGLETGLKYGAKQLGTTGIKLATKEYAPQIAGRTLAKGTAIELGVGGIVGTVFAGQIALDVGSSKTGAEAAGKVGMLAVSLPGFMTGFGGAGKVGGLAKTTGKAISELEPASGITSFKEVADPIVKDITTEFAKPSLQSQKVTLGRTEFVDPLITEFGKPSFQSQKVTLGREQVVDPFLVEWNKPSPQILRQAAATRMSAEAVRALSVPSSRIGDLTAGFGVAKDIRTEISKELAKPSLQSQKITAGREQVVEPLMSELAKPSLQVERQAAATKSGKELADIFGELGISKEISEPTRGKESTTVVKEMLGDFGKELTSAYESPAGRVKPEIKSEGQIRVEKIQAQRNSEKGLAVKNLDEILRMFPKKEVRIVTPKDLLTEEQMSGVETATTKEIDNLINVIEKQMDPNAKYKEITKDEIKSIISPIYKKLGIDISSIEIKMRPDDFMDKHFGKDVGAATMPSEKSLYLRAGRGIDYYIKSISHEIGHNIKTSGSRINKKNIEGYIASKSKIVRETTAMQQSDVFLNEFNKYYGFEQSPVLSRSIKSYSQSKQYMIARAISKILPEIGTTKSEFIVPEIQQKSYSDLLPEEWYGKSIPFEIGTEFTRFESGGARSNIVVPKDVQKPMTTTDLMPEEWAGWSEGWSPLQTRIGYGGKKTILVEAKPQTSIKNTLEVPAKVERNVYPYGRFSILTDRLITQSESMVEIPIIRRPIEQSGLQEGTVRIAKKGQKYIQPILKTAEDKLITLSESTTEIPQVKMPYEESTLPEGIVRYVQKGKKYVQPTPKDAKDILVTPSEGIVEIPQVKKPIEQEGLIEGTVRIAKKGQKYIPPIVKSTKDTLVTPGESSVEIPKSRILNEEFGLPEGTVRISRKGQKYIRPELKTSKDTLVTPSESMVEIPIIRRPIEQSGLQEGTVRIAKKGQKYISKPEKTAEDKLVTEGENLVEFPTHRITKPKVTEELPKIPKVRMSEQLGKFEGKVIIKKDIQGELQKKQEQGRTETENLIKGGAQVTKQGQIVLIEKPEQVFVHKVEGQKLVDLSRMEKMKLPAYVQVTPQIQRQTEKVVPIKMLKTKSEQKLEQNIVYKPIFAQEQIFGQTSIQVSRQITSPIQITKSIQELIQEPIVVQKQIQKQIQIERQIEKQIQRQIETQQERSFGIPLMLKSKQTETKIKHKEKEIKKYKERSQNIVEGAEALFEINPITSKKSQKSKKGNKKQFWEQ